MEQECEQFGGPHDLRAFVSRVLCSRDNLEADCFELTEAPLRRGAAVCGVYFCLHGPRTLRLTAIWETESNTIRFYGSRGEKFKQTRVVGDGRWIAQAA